MVNIKNWKVEDVAFWEKEGNSIANRNLWISISALFVAFAVWSLWSAVIVKMGAAGFTFGLSNSDAINSMLYTLPAIAGLSGATLRIPFSFLVGVSGGRNVLFVSTLLLIIPALGIGISMQNTETPYMLFAVYALISGIGGGAFAASMSNINFFFPKRMKGYALGMNAGLGNLGVSGVQLLLPIAIGYAIYGSLGGDAINVNETSLYLQNSGFMWVPLIIVVSIAIWFGMNNLDSATPTMPNQAKGMGIALLLILFGFIASGIGLMLLIIYKINMWIVLPVTIISTVQLLKYLSPKDVKPLLKPQFAIFKEKHNWIMSILYTMTFGSFIGFAFAFPKLIQDVFGTLQDGSINPNAPNPLHWAFLGPLVGAGIRPIGGWLSDKINSGSKVTQWSTVVSIFAVLGVAYYVLEAKTVENPEVYWWPFFGLFMLLFVTTGLGNGSVFRSVPYIFSPDKASPVLGWIAAIAAYGAFIVPKIIGEQLQAGHVEYALYGFAAFYILCLGLNWWYYERNNSGLKC